MLRFAWGEIRAFRAGARWGSGLVVLLVLTSLRAHPEPPRAALNLTPYTGLLHDAGGTLTVEDVVGASFEEHGHAALNLGIREHALWLRFSLAPQDFRGNQRYLELSNPRLARATLYQQDASGAPVLVASTGREVRFSERPFRSRKLIIPVPIAEDASTYYLQVAQKGSLRFALHLWDPEALAAALARTQLVLGMFYGLLAAMAVYHLFLYASLHQRTYLFYVLLVVAYGLFHASLTGIAQHYLWPNAPTWADQAVLFFNGLAMFCALAFSAHFLDLRERLPRGFAMVAALMALSLLVSAAVFLPSNHANFLAHLIGLVGPSVLFGIGLLLWRRGLKSARLFLLGWTAAFVGTTAFALMGFGLVPENVMTANGVHAGFAVALVLFSLALAERVKLIEQAHRQRLVSLNGLLEQRIAECAEAMQERNASLRSLATQLTHAEQAARRQLSHTLHDHLQQLLVAVQLRLGQLTDAPLPASQRHSLDEAQRMLKEGIVASRDLAAELNPPALQREGLEGALQWLSGVMESRHGLHVTVRADKPGVKLAHEHALLLFEIARELLFNIVKHAGTSSAQVSVCHRNDGWVQIAVEDQGVGFDPEELKGGRGAAGLGLVHIRERLLYLGGRIDITSTRGRGTRIEIATPVVIPQT
jgi:signal transduction histidine kinase